MADGRSEVWLANINKWPLHCLGEVMGVNWFEGGRRIVLTLGALTIFGGAVYLFVGPGEQRIILETTGPDDRFRWTLEDCGYPDVEEAWSGSIEFNPGDPREVVACFRSNKDGKVVYAYGAERIIPVSSQPGQAPMQPLRVREVLSGDSYSDEAQSYINDRVSNFVLTRAEIEAIGAAQWKIGVARFSERAIETFPWIAGLIFSFWVIAAGLGWLVRGFAGIPNGSDYRVDEQNAAARKNRTSLQWLALAVAGWALVSGVGWLALKVIAPGSSANDQVLGGVLHSAGMVLLMVVGLVAFLSGAMALRTLTFRLLKREEPDWQADDKSIWAFGIANGLLLAVISWTICTYTVLGSWVNNLDSWSRANGFADGGTVGLFILCLLWPLVPLYLLNRSSKIASMFRKSVST